MSDLVQAHQGRTLEELETVAIPWHDDGHLSYRGRQVASEMPGFHEGLRSAWVGVQLNSALAGAAPDLMAGEAAPVDPIRGLP